MGSFNQRRAFYPLDLEVIDQVYKAVWAQVEARKPFRNRKRDGERQETIRKRIFAYAGCGPVDFDTLCDQLIATMLESRTPTRPHVARLPVTAPADSDYGTLNTTAS